MNRFGLMTRSLAILTIALLSLRPAEAQAGLDLPEVDRKPIQGRPRRCALIVEGTYADPRLSVDLIASTVYTAQKKGLKDLLEQDLAFDEVGILNGPDCNATGLEKKIRETLGSLQGDENVFLLYWVGHGILLDGQRRYLTYHSRSRERQDDPVLETVSVAEIGLMLDRARLELGSRGAKVSMAAVFEACAESGLGAPTATAPPNDAHSAFDLVAFTTDHREFARREPGSGGRAEFSARLIDLLSERAALANEPVDLKRALSEAHGRRQEVSNLVSGSSIPIFDPRGLRFDVRVFNAARTGLIENATVVLERTATLGREGEERSGGEVTFDGLGPPPMLGYLIRVEAPGYCGRRVRATPGKVIEVRLVPAFDLLNVPVVLPLGAEAEVSVVPAPDPSSSRPRKVRASEMDLKIPRGVPRVEIQAKHAGGNHTLLVELSDLPSEALEDPEAVDVTRFRLSSPLVLEADAVRVQTSIKQPAGKCTLSIGQRTEDVWHSKSNGEWYFDLETSHPVLTVRRGDVQLSIPLDLNDAGSASWERSRLVPVVEIPSIDLIPRRTRVAGVLDFGGHPGPVELVLVDAASQGPASSRVRPRELRRESLEHPGPFDLVVAPHDPEGEAPAGPFELIVEAHGSPALRLQIRAEQAAQRLDDEDRIETVFRVGEIALAVGANATPSTPKVQESADPLDEYWKTLDRCQAAIDKGYLDEAEDLLEDAEGLLPSKKDDRRVFVQYYEALLMLHEAHSLTGQAGHEQRRAALSKFKKITKKRSEIVNPQGLSAYAMALYHIAWVEARTLASDPDSNTYKRNYAKARRDLEREYHGAKSPNKEDLVQLLERQIRNKFR